MKKEKRKTGLIAIGVFVALMLSASVLWLKSYYDSRYVVADFFYTIIPLEYDITPSPMFNSNGALMGYEKRYELVCFNDEGEERILEFRARLDFQDLYPGGTYIKVNVSKTMVLRQAALAEADVPANALNKIKEGYVTTNASTLAEYAVERTRQLSSKSSEAVQIKCEVRDNSLLYSYIYSNEKKAEAEAIAALLEPVFKAQFRSDKALFDELEAIYLEVRLEDGSLVFSGKYDEIVRFGYELH